MRFILVTLMKLLAFIGITNLKCNTCHALVSFQAVIIEFLLIRSVDFCFGQNKFYFVKRIAVNTGEMISVDKNKRKINVTTSIVRTKHGYISSIG